MRNVLALLSATLVAGVLLAGCDKRSDATGTAPSATTPPASAASR